MALLKLCSDAKLLGLTATNVRYLDNDRDVFEEHFDGHIASEMTLGEAVVRGILPAPNYVTTVYQYQKDLARYQTRVDNLRSPGIQDANQKYLDALCRALEQTDGLDKVLNIISQTNPASTSCSASARNTWTRWCPMCRSGLQGSTQMWCTKPTPMIRIRTRRLRTLKRTPVTG